MLLEIIDTRNLEETLMDKCFTDIIQRNYLSFFFLLQAYVIR